MTLRILHAFTGTFLFRVDTEEFKCIIRMEANSINVASGVSYWRCTDILSEMVFAFKIS